MDVTPLVKSGQQILQSYSDGGFKVSEQRYDGAVIVLPDQTVSWDFDGSSVGDLTLTDFEPLIARAAQIDVVLLGCGANIQFLSNDLRSALKDKGLSVDVMDSGAACRTFNVLIAEGRRVSAALLPV